MKPKFSMLFFNTLAWSRSGDFLVIKQIVVKHLRISLKFILIARTLSDLEDQRVHYKKQGEFYYQITSRCNTNYTDQEQKLNEFQGDFGFYPITQVIITSVFSFSL